MKLAEELRSSADHIWKKILEHPFVIELYSGTLPFEKFKYYVIQDYNYLITICKCFSLIASKAEYAIAQRMLELAHMEATIEMDNYRDLLNRLGIKLEDVVKADPSPTNIAYMNFLLATCSLEPPLSGLVSLLPCFWSYAEIASKHEDKLKDNQNDIYVEWAETYTTKEYLDLVEELKTLVNQMSKYGDCEKLRNIFLTASKYEYMFWDMAYKMEKWPI